MVRFNVLSLIFLLIAFIFFLFSSFSITGDLIAIDKISFIFLNLFSLIFSILFFIVFLSGKKLEAILVPTGSHKTDKERAKEGADYYHEHEKDKPVVLISGSVSGKYRERFLSSQPGHIYKYMRKSRIPKDAFLFEPKSKNTVENVLFSADEIRKKGIKQVDVVSNPSHLWRFKFLFNKAKEEGLIDKDVKINYIPTRKNILFEDVGDAIYGITSYLKYLTKWGRRPLKSLNKKNE